MGFFAFLSHPKQGKYYLYTAGRYSTNIFFKELLLRPSSFPGYSKNMMTVLMMKMLLVLFFIKYVICAKGFVDEILLNRRFYCPLSFSETSTVTSEIQCTQRCLRKECKLLNYNTKQGKKDNCEIYAHTNECSTLINQDNWKAVSFQVYIFQYFSTDSWIQFSFLIYLSTSDEKVRNGTRNKNVIGLSMVW